MNNRELSKILKSHPVIEDKFIGVFPADLLPTDKKPGFYVANTDPHNKPGRHWVAFYVPRKEGHYMEYWDSYGFPPAEIFSQFLDSEYKRSTKFTQHPLSATCGQYCIYYVLNRCYGNSFENTVSYFSENQLTNDILVNKFVEDNFCVDLDIFDVAFINKQFCRSFQDG